MQQQKNKELSTQRRTNIYVGKIKLIHNNQVNKRSYDTEREQARQSNTSFGYEEE